MLDQEMIVVGVTVLVMFSPGPDMAIVTRNTLAGGRGGGLIANDASRPDLAARPTSAGKTWFLQGLIYNVVNPRGTLLYLGVFAMPANGRRRGVPLFD